MAKNGTAKRKPLTHLELFEKVLEGSSEFKLKVLWANRLQILLDYI
jgi:hypothetical protein